MEKCDILIIGGGPAGLFTAINLHKNKKVILIEKNNRPGKKLLLAGAGRCNITHAGKITDFFGKYGGNARFLKTALQNFTNTDLISFFNKRGLSTIKDKNGKIFPKSENALDVLNTLVEECEKCGVNINNTESVISINKAKESFTVQTNKSDYKASQIIIATGGLSYPGTGSTGDGYRFAKNFGHNIVEPRPSLTPIYVDNYKFANISGVSLTERPIHLYRNGKKVKEYKGDIGFTHKGISGPGILDFSRFFQKGDTITINLINQTQEILREALVQGNENSGKTSVKNFLAKYDLPESLVKAVLNSIEIDSKTTLACLTKKLRNVIVDQFCNHPFKIGKIGNFKIAMATTGGITITEIFPKTMESKLIEGLYFAGEVIDIDGDTGGYNIQAAFSTGRLAADSINKSEQKKESSS